ncbi:unnamed protein product, partial [Iphiclides podalirius]
MNEGPMKRGIWRGWYTDENGNERIYATTHFQPYNARQAFPCWDEPLYKSVFKLHLSRPESYSGTFSNTGIESSIRLANNRVRDNFYPTPRMSSYLVTFLISESFGVIAEDTSIEPPIRIIGRSNTKGLGDRALELTVKMAKYFDEFFGISYSDLHPYLYNDHVSSPDWASAGTENWGMVSYSAYEATDQYDLYDAFAEAAQEDGTLSEYRNFDFAEYYRVWVNEPGYPLLTVNVNHETGEMSLSQVVDDVFALMRSERMTYDFGFKILRFLRNEVNYHVWNPAITGYNWLRNRLRHIPESQAVFDFLILSNMERVIEKVGYDAQENENPTTSLTRQEVLHFACTLGHEKVNPRIRRNVYVNGIRHGDRSDFQFLLNRMSNSNFANDQLEMLRGLGAARQPELLTQYLEITLTKAVRSHDKANSFNYALLGNQENAHTLLQFVKNNIDRMREAYIEDAPPTPVHTCLSNLAAYLDEAGLVEYEDWLRTTQSNSLQFNSAISAINSARNNMAWGTANADTIIAAAKGGVINVMVSTALLVTMAIVAILV